MFFFFSFFFLISKQINDFNITFFITFKLSFPSQSVGYFFQSLLCFQHRSNSLFLWHYTFKAEKKRCTFDETHFVAWNSIFYIIESYQSSSPFTAPQYSKNNVSIISRRQQIATLNFVSLFVKCILSNISKSYLANGFTCALFSVFFTSFLMFRHSGHP